MGAIILIAATYNPTGWCYLSLVDRYPALPASIVLLSGFVLMVGFIKYFRQSYGAVGAWGIAGLSFFFVAALWTLSDFHVVDLNDHNVGIWALLLVLSLILSIAASWPELRRLRLLGRREGKRDSGKWLDLRR